MSTIFVSCQRILTQERSFQISMKSSSAQFCIAILSRIRCTTRISSSESSTLYAVVFTFSWRPPLVPSNWFLYRDAAQTRVTENTCHVIPTHCCITSLCIRKLHENRENTAAVLSCDVTAYVEMCLPSFCLEKICIIPLCVYYLTTAVSVARQFLHGANIPQCHLAGLFLDERQVLK
jgi:hypothetical protein